MPKCFVDTLNQEEKQKIQKRADVLVKGLEKWIRPYPCIRSVRIPAIALVAATVMPTLHNSLIMGQIMLWIFALDDIADGRLVPLSQLEGMAEPLYQTARHGLSNNDDELAASVLDIRQQLSGSPLFELLCEQWAGDLRRLVEAMTREYWYGLQYTTCKTLPPLNEYLDNGVHTIATPFWGSTTLILLKDWSVLQRLEAIDQVLKYAGYAIRLYNDVRTFQKEIQEGGVNSILIIQNTSRKTLQEAQEHVLGLAELYARKCYDVVSQLKTDSEQFEQIVRRLVALHAHFYGQGTHDYHLISKSQMYQVLA